MVGWTKSLIFYRFWVSYTRYTVPGGLLVPVLCLLTERIVAPVSLFLANSKTRLYALHKSITQAYDGSFRYVQSVSILSPPSPSSLLAWSCNALKNGSTPVPASAGSPSVLTRSPSSPVRSAMSRFLTAARNWGEMTICSRTSMLGGLGRSGGRCGKSDCASSGRVVKSGRRFAGVRTSVSEISGSGCC